MSKSDSIGIQEQDLRALEVRVEELIRTCAHLKDENRTLRARVEQLNGQNHQLSEVNKDAQQRVSGLIDRLKDLEAEA